MNECCGTCNYFCAVRQSPTYEQVLTHICTYFLLTERADYILETTYYDMCECHSKRKDI